MSFFHSRTLSTLLPAFRIYHKISLIKATSLSHLMWKPCSQTYLLQKLQCFHQNLTGFQFQQKPFKVSEDVSGSRLALFGETISVNDLYVVYSIHCVRCGLMYVGETGRSLRSRINGHRTGIIKDGQSLLYKHFRLHGHSVANIKIQILGKIHHSSENPVNIRLHRRLRELHWIKELGTAAPYGCNDQIKGVSTFSSPSCKHTNVLGIFSKQQRRKRSHGHRHYNRKTPQLDSSIDTFINLIDSIDQPQGVYNIKTTLFSISSQNYVNYNHLP